MDAHAHLLSLGWAGPGHALDSRPYKQKGRHGLAYDSKTCNTGVGLVKPLLISQRKDRFGIGKKTHEPAAGNEWWLKGFETALGNIGKSESERTSGTATPIDTGRVTGKQKHEGLYTFFVKGQEMEGTIGEEMCRRGRKRRSGEMEGEVNMEAEGVGGAEGIGKDEKDAAEEFADEGMFIRARDKDEKRRKKGEKAKAFCEFQQTSEFFGAKTEKEKKKRKPETQDASASLDVEEDGGPIYMETKEKRRERRRLRKEEKAAKVAEKSSEQLSKTPVELDEVLSSKSEKKRRKGSSMKR